MKTARLKPQKQHWAMQLKIRYHILNTPTMRKEACAEIKAIMMVLMVNKVDHLLPFKTQSASQLAVMSAWSYSARIVSENGPFVKAWL